MRNEWWNGRSLRYRWEAIEKGLEDWHGEEKLSIGGRTHFLSYSAIVLKDTANSITLVCLVYRLIATLIPFRK